MNDSMILSAIGLSHKTAPIEIRERMAFAEADLPSVLGTLRGRGGIRECMLLSTCNRTEVYLITPGAPRMTDVAELLADARGVPPEAFAPSLYQHCGMPAARHVMRVASGLDSMVLGEQQILGQVKRAFDLARLSRSTGPVLNRLMALSITTGRRVRRETGVSRSAPSVPRAALSLAKRTLGSLNGRAALVVGAGEAAGLVVKLLVASGARVVAVANRTVESARGLAALAGAEAVPLEAIVAAGRGVDLMVVCVGASAPLVSPAMVGGDRDRPLLVLDLGIPRGVDATVAALPGVALHVLDQLPVEPASGGAPPEELARAEEIVEAALAGFEEWMASRMAAPMIAALHDRADRVVEGELARARARLQGLDETQYAAVRAVARAVARKLLQAPIVRLRRSAARQDARALELACELFDLAVDPEGSREA
ncbi:MAG: glutamyl-tRNA reductase [Armatimonadetes bacterium]|nr:glutamyl-tRNA reductase [Armatimonadota bacterium]